MRELPFAIFLGILVFAGLRLIGYIKERGKTWPKIRFSRWITYIRSIAVVIITMHACSLMITLHWVSLIGPEIELNPLWRFVFEKTGSLNLWVPLLTATFIIMTLLYIERKHPEIFDFIGLSFCIILLMDYLNNTLLINPILPLVYSMVRLLHPELLYDSTYQSKLLLIIFISDFAISYAISLIISYGIRHIVHKRMIIK